MRERFYEPEDLILSLSALGLLFASLAVKLLAAHRHFGNPRLQYGFHHLPGALFMAFLFLVLLVFLRRSLLRSRAWHTLSTPAYLLAIVILFSIFWIPILKACSFVQDDWMLLAAASIRKVLWAHPLYAWNTLDPVDGNFRPLSTSLYISTLFRLFGLHSAPFLIGSFFINLLTCITAFFIVVRLGYSRLAGFLAAALYLSRDLTYSENVWMAASSDALAILFAALTILVLLHANRGSRAAAPLLHLLAWILFVAAVLSKQVAFALPVIIVLLLFLRPGEDNPPPRPQRLASAVIAAVVYGATAVFLFLHAKKLLHGAVPYPMSISFAGVVSFFSYITWFFGPLDFAGKGKLPLLTALAGAAILVLAVRLLRRNSTLLGSRPKDILFLLLSAAAGLCVLFPLGGRAVSYYGGLFALWASAAIAILFTNALADAASVSNSSRRIAAFVLCLFLGIGFLSIHLKQTGLIAPGGYVWGTYGMDREKALFHQISDQLAQSPSTRNLVLSDVPSYHSISAGMAILQAPSLHRILYTQTPTGTWTANNHEGLLPIDGPSGLTDFRSYNWLVPIDAATAAALLPPQNTLTLSYKDDVLRTLPPAAQ